LHENDNDRKDLSRVVGDFMRQMDESYFMYVEDLDYSYKVWKSGYKLYHMPTSKVWHKVGASNGEDEVSEFSAYWIYRNSLKFKLKMKNGFRKIVALLIHYLSRPVIYLKWLFKNPRIAKQLLIAQITFFRRK